MSFSGFAKLAGVMGWPVAHSLSPRLHGYWLNHYGINGAYVPLAVQPDKLAAALKALPVLGFQGCNLTLPYKETALELIDMIDPVAARIGAVNTVVVQADGKLKGYNTDYLGFVENLKAKAPGWAPGPAVVIGAGGAARAVVVGLMEMGVPEIRIVNRTEGKAQIIAEGLADGRVQLRPWPFEFRQEALKGAALLVNTTNLGMIGQPELELDLADLPKEAVVYDIVYNPLKTPLLQQAEAGKHRIVTGIGMLLHQAAPGFEMWFGRRPEVTEEQEKFVLKGLPA